VDPPRGSGLKSEWRRISGSRLSSQKSHGGRAALVWAKLQRRRSKGLTETLALGSRFGNSGAPAAYLRIFLTLLATKTKQTGRQLRRESRRRIRTFLCEK